MDKETCYQIANNVAKRYEVIGKDWDINLGECTIKIKLPNDMIAKFSFNVEDNTLYASMDATVPFSENLELLYFSKDSNIYTAEVSLKRENNSLVYRFTIGEKLQLKDRDTLMQGKFIDEMLKKLSIENL